MNSLEDAFVNIGMDEHNILKKKKNVNPNLKDEYTNFNDIEIP